MTEMFPTFEAMNENTGMFTGYISCLPFVAFYLLVVYAA